MSFTSDTSSGSVKTAEVLKPSHIPVVVNNNRSQAPTNPRLPPVRKLIKRSNKSVEAFHLPFFLNLNPRSVYNKIDEVDETNVRWKFIMCVFFSVMRELLSDPKILVCSQMFKQHMHTEGYWATFAKQSADFVNMCTTYRDLKFKLQHSYATRHITACPYEKSKYHRFPISYQLL